MKLPSFSDTHVLIVGDVMLDHYVSGRVAGESPEAPVPVLKKQKEWMLPGGAANVARNVKSLGAKPFLVSVLGRDKAGKTLEKLLEEQDIPTRFVMQSVDRPTTIKTRLLAEEKHLLRWDSEVDDPLDEGASERIVSAVKNVVNHTVIDVCILQDYDKGVLNKNNIKPLLAFLNEAGIPVVVDPKFRNIDEYLGVDILKPNLRELQGALDQRLSGENKTELFKAMQMFKQKQQAKTVLTTLSEHGAAACNEEEEIHVPAWPRNIVDVSGAGDTVVSVAALLRAASCSLYMLCAVSNLAGGLVCEESGVSTLTEHQLQEAAKEITNE